MQPSNSGTRRGRTAAAVILAAVVAALAGTTVYVHRHIHDPIVITYWWIGNAALIFCMWAFVRGRRFLHLPVAPGPVVAIVPAYNEDPDDLDACIWSILNQRHVTVDEVHVVDDGSVPPVERFEHPRVHWHRKRNAGKRAAQVYVLGRLDPARWRNGFVLTVDGDSVLAPDALAHLLKAFTNGRVMAATGMVLVRNWRHNLLTRIADINIGTSCVMMRASRSLLGTLETTSGALAVYRARILFKHRLRYLAAGTYGDDRALAMYSALEGEVVGVNEAVVWSNMPTTFKTTYRQRLRWSKSWWCMIPFVLTNMRRPGQMFFPLFGLMQLTVAPITIGYLLYAVAAAALGDSINWAGIVLYAAVYMTVRYAEVALYMIERPGMGWPAKLATWLLLTPVEAAYNLLFLNPTKYIALLRLRDHGWGTRGNTHATPQRPVGVVAGGRRRRLPDAPPPPVLAEAVTAHTGRPNGRRHVNDEPTRWLEPLTDDTRMFPIAAASPSHAAPRRQPPARAAVFAVGWLLAALCIAAFLTAVFLPMWL